MVTFIPHNLPPIGRGTSTDGMVNETASLRHATTAIIINENADPGFRLNVVSALGRSDRDAFIERFGSGFRSGPRR
jgi:hypothetical protein